MSTSSSTGRADRLLQVSGPGPADIFALIADRLAECEVLFRESLESPVQIVQEIGSFVGETGGKRVRPTLHLLCARLCDYRGPHDIVLGTVLEFIHSATLIHDDIIDGASTRRGRPSVNENWGSSITVLFGDYLFAKAMQMALRAGSLAVMDTLAQVTLRMVEGEMIQTRYEGRTDLSEQEYVDLVERKTAALFSACGDLAGILAAVGDEKQRALSAYGRNLGMAFQVVDDLLDFTGDSERLGKPAGMDLREGKATLPVIDLLKSGSSEAQKLARSVVEQRGDVDASVRRLTAMMQENGSLARAQERAEQYAANAALELVHFPDNDARRALQALPDLLLTRDR